MIVAVRVYRFLRNGYLCEDGHLDAFMIAYAHHCLWSQALYSSRSPGIPNPYLYLQAQCLRVTGSQTLSHALARSTPSSLPVSGDLLYHNKGYNTIAIDEAAYHNALCDLRCKRRRLAFTPGLQVSDYSTSKATILARDAAFFPFGSFKEDSSVRRRASLLTRLPSFVINLRQNHFHGEDHRQELVRRGQRIMSYKVQSPTFFVDSLIPRLWE